MTGRTEESIEFLAKILLVPWTDYEFQEFFVHRRHKKAISNAVPPILPVNRKQVIIKKQTIDLEECAEFLVSCLAARLRPT